MYILSELFKEIQFQLYKTLFSDVILKQKDVNNNQNSLVFVLSYLPAVLLS